MWQWMCYQRLASMPKMKATPWARDYITWLLSASRHSQAFYLHIKNCTALIGYLRTLLCSGKDASWKCYYEFHHMLFSVDCWYIECGRSIWCTGSTFRAHTPFAFLANCAINLSHSESTCCGLFLSHPGPIRAQRELTSSTLHSIHTIWPSV